MVIYNIYQIDTALLAITNHREHSKVVEKEPPRNRVKYPVRKRNGGSE